MQKIAIDAGFTCPNIDGTKGAGGCTYCNNEGFSYNSRRPPRSIEEQIENGAAFMRKRFKADKFMAYFQANTNTYAPLGELKKLYDRILPYPEIVSMAVGTRPDCVSPPYPSIYWNPMRTGWKYGWNMACNPATTGHWNESTAVTPMRIFSGRSMRPLGEI